MKVKSESEVAQSCPILSDPMDYSPPSSSVHGIFQARVLEWGAIAFSEETNIEVLKIQGREAMPRKAVFGEALSCQCKRCEQKTIVRASGGGITVIVGF